MYPLSRRYEIKNQVMTKTRAGMKIGTSASIREYRRRRWHVLRRGVITRHGGSDAKTKISLIEAMAYRPDM